MDVSHIRAKALRGAMLDGPELDALERSMSEAQPLDAGFFEEPLGDADERAAAAFAATGGVPEAAPAPAEALAQHPEAARLIRELDAMRSVLFEDRLRQVEQLLSGYGRLVARDVAAGRPLPSPSAVAAEAVELARLWLPEGR